MRIPIPVPEVGFVIGYLIEDAAGAVHAIDPGWDDDTTWELLASALARFGKDIADIASIASTHLHFDHYGMAPRLGRATGARVRLGGADREIVRANIEMGGDAEPPLERWGVPRTYGSEMRTATRNRIVVAADADADLAGDMDLGLPGRALRTLATPGHTPGHTSLIDDTARIVFTGDHLLRDSFPGIGLGGPDDPRPIERYFRSLAALLRLDGYRVCPGHEGSFDDLVPRVRQTAEHHLHRSREVAALVDSGASLSVWETASRLSWGAGFANLRGMRLRSALAQTAMHIDFVETPFARRLLERGVDALEE